MLFNSQEFIFVFAPITFGGFYLLGSMSRRWALHWLILASFVLYACWRPFNVLLIAPSILANFGLARALQRLGKNENHRKLSKAVLLLGIAFNVAFLGYFKYANFVVATMNDVLGSNLVFTHIILPLGVSFITFQKIAFLIDVQAGRVGVFTLRDYCLFVLFFPQLIAGPIVHFRELMPQFDRASCRFESENISVGLTLFLIGLFKKVVLADNIATYVSPIYEQAAVGGVVSLIPSWMAAIGFTLQIYFDFSGYTDMALGLARFVGIRLPPNFDSPLKASSIIDFWLRWHMTLTRFLTAYIYNPMVLWLTRRRLAAGRPGVGAHGATVGAFVVLLMFPMLATMFISGLWHGAGYQFVVWGLLHGVYLTINHAWRLVVPRFWPDRSSYSRFMQPVGWGLTFLAVTITMIFFRSPTMAAALELMKGIIGLNGISLPQPIFDQIGPLAGWLHSVGVVAEPGSGRNFLMMTAWTGTLLLIALGVPNTLKILDQYEPALGVGSGAAGKQTRGAALAWNPSLAWAIVVSVMAALGIFRLGDHSEFLYWQF
jgi:alginate O-acetyltransferase complex protein AlgI